MNVLALSCFCVDVFPELGDYYVGGNALNVASSVQMSSDAKVFLMGAIGKDELGEKLKAFIDHKGMDRRYLHEKEGVTASNKIYLTDDGERYFKEDSWQGGVYQGYLLPFEDQKALQQMDLVITTIHDSVLLQVIEEKKKNDFLLAVDFHDDAYTTAWEEIVPWVDIFFMSGRAEMMTTLCDWSNKYTGVFVATMGAAGSIAYYKGEKYSVAASKVENIVDTTGCGDSYLGAFAVSYYESPHIITAMKKGSLAAAKNLSHMGGAW